MTALHVSFQETDVFKSSQHPCWKCFWLHIQPITTASKVHENKCNLIKKYREYSWLCIHWGISMNFACILSKSLMLNWLVIGVVFFFRINFSHWTFHLTVIDFLLSPSFIISKQALHIVLVVTGNPNKQVVEFAIQNKKCTGSEWQWGIIDVSNLHWVLNVGFIAGHTCTYQLTCDPQGTKLFNSTFPHTAVLCMEQLLW